MNKQLYSEQRAALLETIARFDLYCEQNPQAEGGPKPTTAALNQGEVMGLLQDFVTLDVYQAVRREFIANARPTGPHHSA